MYEVLINHSHSMVLLNTVADFSICRDNDFGVSLLPRLKFRKNCENACVSKFKQCLLQNDTSSHSKKDGREVTGSCVVECAVGLICRMQSKLQLEACKRYLIYAQWNSIFQFSFGRNFVFIFVAQSMIYGGHR